VRLLHDEWGVDRLAAGASIGATPADLRDAGCTAREMLAASPREELRRLDTRESTWVLAGPALLDAGFSVAEKVKEIAAHAPTAATFAAAVTAIVENPVDALTLALPRATAADLTALSERLGLSPAETAHALSAACADQDTVVAVMVSRCDGDTTPALGLATEVLGMQMATVEVAEGVDRNAIAPAPERLGPQHVQFDTDLAIVDL